METLKDPFHIIPAKGNNVPIIISIPHCGTEIPSEIKEDYIPSQAESLDDTDWFLQQLYDFAPDLGITIVYARYSRWVIDLNRSSELIHERSQL